VGILPLQIEVRVMTLSRWFLAIGLSLLAIDPGWSADDKPVVTRIGGLKAPAPKTWKSEKPANLLRSYQFKLVSPDKDFADAELAVFPESSPKWEDKFKEWKETVIPPDGSTIDQAAKVSKFEVEGKTVQVLDISGNWKYRERPRDPSSKEMLRPEYRVIWFVVLDEEATHVRFSGPEKVVAKHHEDVLNWIKSLKK
jgi:hypothetical protein